MVRRTVLFPLLLLSLLVPQGPGRADSLLLDNGAIDGAPATFAPQAAANPNLLFRNGLTDVEVKNDSGTASLKDLAAGTVWGSKAVTLQQGVNDKISLEGQSAMNTTQTGDLPKAALLSGSGSSAASGTTRLAAKWKPLDPLAVSLSTTSESSLNRDRETGKSSLMRDTQEIKTEWKAFPSTKLSLTLAQEKFQSDASYDARTTATARFSQALWKSGLTWNAGHGWRNEKPDSTNPTSTMTGGVNETSLDWAPAKGRTLSLGGSWGDMDTAATAARESTRNLFLNWDQSLSQRLRLQMGATYGTKVDSIGGTPYWSGENATFDIGQTLLLTDTASARFEVNHSIAQENGVGWKTSESIATFSLRKLF
ncbi:hypothetical protein SAMN05444156_1879 [Verrucomicrobium sp. GAS474]|uniref:hypothetical protein n=1 Tax=Verrucomicrobium sp. GAS474 TaxID=1882831 RepID=UPI00087CEF64|nr:hypothetical protein [Verrucomicrobium sp. GAS474]SDU08659.1 hypothetical protein SAMN05444156_1879 [Verrucomicrobium sp. GAS474]